MTAFASAVDAWLWYCQALALRQSGSVPGFGAGRGVVHRACELSDVVIPVARAARRGVLTERHLRVLRVYGAEQREPVADHPAEAEDARLWREAMEMLGREWQRKGVLA